MENVTDFIAQHMGLFYLLAAGLVGLMLIEFIRSKRGQSRIDPKAAVLLINKNNAVVVDVRSKESFQSGHIVDAINSPLREWPTNAKKLDKYKKKPMIVVCSNGIDSQKAATNLAKEGYTAYILAGGMRAWSGADLPSVKE